MDSLCCFIRLCCLGRLEAFCLRAGWVTAICLISTKEVLHKEMLQGKLQPDRRFLPCHLEKGLHVKEVLQAHFHAGTKHRSEGTAHNSQGTTTHPCKYPCKLPCGKESPGRGHYHAHLTVPAPTFLQKSMFGVLQVVVTWKPRLLAS